MCGIAGLLISDSSAAPDPLRLQAMVDALAHRGPDDHGFYVDRNAGLGVRRLSIVDVAGGRQPIANEDGSVRVVYNGECYNFADLADDLRAAGHRFATRADTEVLVHGYEEWGIAGLVARLNGIYAFCLWDARKRAAFLVRDRLGVKPLYYVARANAFAFSSELRSLVRSGLCLPKLDEQAIWEYLLYQFPPTERTPLAGVVRLAPGHVLEWRADGRFRIERYWDFPDGSARDHASFETAAERVADLLDDAVRRQLIGDVPAGCFLSGGLDSSAIAMLMSRYSRGLRTYSIGYPRMKDYDETPYATLVANAIGADHIVVPLDEAALLNHVDGYLARIDEPVADAAMFATDLLAARAARDVKVVLTGEGADELFAGYEYYRRFVAPLDSASHPQQTNRFQPAWFAPGLPSPLPGMPSPISGFPYTTRPEFVWCLLAQDRRPSFDTFRQVLAAVEARWMSGTEGCTPLQRALYVDTKVWLGHNLMTKLDKATMAHGLEARVPMLDHRLVELVFTLPDDYKVDADGGKRVLRRALRSIVPETILTRSKQGFGVPIAEWLRTLLYERVRQSLQGSVLIDEGLVTPDGVAAILDAHVRRHTPLDRLIWSLVNIDAWWRQVRPEIVAALPADGAIPVSPRPDKPTVDIVIPVYGALNLVRDCVRSIQDSTDRPFRALLIHDGGGEIERARLRELIDGDARFEIVASESNEGYVRSCITGIERGTADYVVLLNSDTVVTPTWLDRLVDCAESDPRIAVVNPLTNESGNTSVRLAPGLNVRTMAHAVAAQSRSRYPDITTAVGMCMLIRRSAMELLGGIDAAFDIAYCEESDLCMRFTEAGLRVVAADDAFIYHKGMGSYTDAKKQTLYDRNRVLFDERWAVAYERDWDAYARSDPLQPTRDRLLRDTVPQHADASVASAIEDRPTRPGAVRTIAACANGARTRAAALLLGAARPPRRIAGDVSRARIASRARFDERAVVYPTRAYIDSMPACDPGKLRITFLVSSFPLCGGIISVAQLVRAMVAAGHDVKIATEASRVVPEQLNLWAQPLVYRNRAQLLDLFPPSDVVVATYWTTAHDYLGALHRRYRFVSAYFIQDYEAWFYDEIDDATRRKVVRTYATADHRIVKSRWLADMVGQHGQACDIVPIGLDLDAFYPRQHARSERCRVISTAKPSTRRRGFAETVEIFRRIHELRPGVELAFFGTEGETLPTLPFPYTDLGSEYDQNRVAAMLSSADVLLDASQWQGFGRPGLEAMACGTVPVLTGVGGLHEYARDGYNCFMGSPADAGRMTANVLTLLDDPVLYERLRAAGLETARRFSHDKEAARHLALYEEWVSGAASSTGASSWTATGSIPRSPGGILPAPDRIPTATANRSPHRPCGAA